MRQGQVSEKEYTHIGVEGRKVTCCMFKLLLLDVAVVHVGIVGVACSCQIVRAKQMLKTTNDTLPDSH